MCRPLSPKPLSVSGPSPWGGCEDPWWSCWGTSLGLEGSPGRGEQGP